MKARLKQKEKGICAKGEKGRETEGKRNLTITRILRTRAVASFTPLPGESN